MPTLGAPLDFAKLEGRNFQAHQLGSAPSSPVKGQLYYNTADNTLWWWDGTQWVSARGGAAAIGDATASTKGIIQLAGDLAGTAASPQIAAGAIIDADVAAANKDGAVGTPSLRTLGSGATQAAPGNDARFTDARAPTAHKTTHEPGGSDALTVDAAAGVGSFRTLGLTGTKAMPGTSTLDVITPPAADVNMNGKKILSVATPVSASDGANKAYVDAAAQGLDAKASVRCATTANIPNLAAVGVIDGITHQAGDRILVKDQTTPAQNGIYTSDGVSLSRAFDMDAWIEVPSSYVWVEVGTVNADTGWLCTSDQGGTINTTPITWVQFSGAAQVIAGAGLTKSSNTLDVGAGAGITVNPDSIQVANNGITNAMIADGAIDLSSADVINLLPIAKGGTNSSSAPNARTALAAAGYYMNAATHAAGTTIVIPQSTHGLRATKSLIVQVQDDATGNVLLPDISVATNGDVTVTFAVSQAANTIRVTVIG